MRYSEHHAHDNAECPCIEAGTSAKCPGDCHRENDEAAQALIDHTNGSE